MAVLLAAACISDWRTRRIPNALCVSGAMLGLALHALAPAEGPWLLQAGAPGGTPQSLGGLLLALAAGMALWQLGLFGAGDAKLLAAVGAWVGAASVLPLVLLTLLAGGVLAAATLAAQALSPRPTRPLPYSLAVTGGAAALLAVRALELAR